MTIHPAAVAQLADILDRQRADLAREAALPVNYHFWLGEGDKRVLRMHKRNGGQPIADLKNFQEIK